MPDKIRLLAQNILHNPFELNIAISKPPEKIVQEAFVLYEAQKIPLIKEILRSKKFESIIVFCSKKLNVKELTHELKRTGLRVDEIHSDLDQAVREETLLRFKNKTINILVATDILSRGIDIEDIDLVINYDVPHDGEDYVHRIGRTARAATDGTAYTFITEKEQKKFYDIEILLEKEITKAKVPDFLGETPAYNPNIRRKPYKKKRNFKHKKTPKKSPRPE